MILTSIWKAEMQLVQAFFGEVVKTYSNVEGGAGIFAAVSGVRIEVPVK